MAFYGSLVKLYSGIVYPLTLFQFCHSRAAYIVGEWVLGTVRFVLYGLLSSTHYLGQWTPSAEDPGESGLPAATSTCEVLRTRILHAQAHVSATPSAGRVGKTQTPKP